MLDAPFPAPLVTRSGGIGGNKTGHNATDPLLIAWSDDFGYVFSSPSQVTYSMTANWRAPLASIPGTLYGLQFTKQASGAPNTYGVTVDDRYAHRGPTTSITSR